MNALWALLVEVGVRNEIVPSNGIKVEMANDSHCSSSLHLLSKERYESSTTVDPFSEKQHAKEN